MNWDLKTTTCTADDPWSPSPPRAFTSCQNASQRLRFQFVPASQLNRGQETEETAAPSFGQRKSLIYFHIRGLKSSSLFLLHSIKILYVRKAASAWFLCRRSAAGAADPSRIARRPMAGRRAGKYRTGNNVYVGLFWVKVSVLSILYSCIFVMVVGTCF